MPTNPFATDTAAWAYAVGRPDHSPFVAEIIRRLVGIEGTVPVAVDVGSGTGISARALVPLADRVIAVEPSSAMLGHATEHPSVEYRLGTAEELPVRSGTCGCV